MLNKTVLISFVMIVSKYVWIFLSTRLQLMKQRSLRELVKLSKKVKGKWKIIH